MTGDLRMTFAVTLAMGIDTGCCYLAMDPDSALGAAQAGILP